MNTLTRERLWKNLQDVEQRIGAACTRAGRERSTVTLIAVTKSVTAEVAALLPGLGVFDLGESRPQELWHKAAQVATPVRWHMIGHLQRNKIERTLPLSHLVHSVDSLRLLQSVDAWAATAGQSVNLLLEVNASGEAAKNGFRPEELDTLIDIVPGLRHVCVRGLMTMAAYTDDPADARPTFTLLRQCQERLQSACGATVQLSELSMGMSHDFEVAIAEGATMIRLGTILFEGIVAE